MLITRQMDKSSSELTFIVTKQSREKPEQIQNQHSAWNPQDRKTSYTREPTSNSTPAHAGNILGTFWWLRAWNHNFTENTKP